MIMAMPPAEVDKFEIEKHPSALRYTGIYCMDTFASQDTEYDVPFRISV